MEFRRPDRTVLQILKKAPFLLLIGVSAFVAVSFPLFMRLMTPTFEAGSDSTQAFLLAVAILWALAAIPCSFFLGCVVVATLAAVFSRHTRRDNSDNGMRACALGAIALVGVLAVACGPSEADIAQRVGIAVAATRVAEPTSTPYPTPEPQAPSNWHIAPDDTLTLTTFNTEYSHLAGYAEMWTLVLTCSPKSNQPFVAAHRVGGNIYLGEFEEVVETTVGVGYDDNYWEENWWLNQIFPGTNYLSPDAIETSILALMDAQTLDLSLFYEGETETETVTETVTFDVSGLDEFIEKPTDLCE